MKLSILIPTHNYDCRPLVRSLLQQIENLDEECEIIVADDGSDQTDMVQKCSEINDLPHCRFIALSQNIGRAAIRNYLGREAKGEWLMFMDQDGTVVYLHFLKKYLDAAHDCDVVCGGIRQSHHRPRPRYSLRYDYEVRSQKRFSANERQNDPTLPFRTFCFMIRRDAFMRVPFDESFTDYGYEDVLFGHHLREAGLRIRHINNPLKNDDLETNDVFVAKTEEALRTLHQHEDLFKDDVRLVKTVNRLDELHLLPLVKTFSGWLTPRLRRNLSSNDPSTRYFDLYKLLYYVGLK